MARAGAMCAALRKSAGGTKRTFFRGQSGHASTGDLLFALGNDLPNSIAPRTVRNTKLAEIAQLTRFLL